MKSVYIKYGVISALINPVNKQNHWRKEENRKRDQQKHNWLQTQP